VGNVRDNNQDRAHFGGYVAAVADGMGGHQGGEMAASIAIKEFLELDEPIGPGGLVGIVEEANRAVFERAADPDLRGMGTTLVAMTLRPEDEAISVVNVGDSRAYFLRGTDFKQLTLDHSLVEDLVRQNRLTPEEALTHPQRNILTRALGIASEVEVDRFLHEAEIGDRYLLCSDGLFNEVTEEEITRILLEFKEPNIAADTLVNAALAGAARDNVTVAVVDVVANGQGGNVSTHAANTIQVPMVATGEDTVEVERPPVDAEQLNGANEVVAGPSPTPTDEDLNFGEGADPQNQGEPIKQSAGLTQAGAAAAGVDLADIDLAAEERAYHDGMGTVDTVELQPAPASRRRPRLGRILFGFVVLAALAGAAYYAINSYATNKWHVAPTQTGQLAILKGRVGGFLWIEPEEIEVKEDVLFDDLVEEDQIKVNEREEFDSRSEADRFIDELQVKPSGVDTLEQIESTDEETGEPPATSTNAGSETDSTPSTVSSTTSTVADVTTPTTTG
jgi:protein phosphatase